MALYEKQFSKPYPNGYVDKPQKTTPVTANILNMQDKTLSALEDFLASEEVTFKKGLTVGARLTTLAVGEYSLVIGMGAATGQASFAMGRFLQANGNCAAAIGNSTYADGAYSVAAGVNSKALGNASVAMGNGVQASGTDSFAEGIGTKALGMSSHAEGRLTIAAGANQHVQGTFNVEDTENNFAHIVGGGTSNNDRKNIHTLDWQGNAWYAGDIINGNGISLDGLADLINAVPEWALQPEKPVYTKDEIGLGNADNTSDIAKPVSTAQQEAIDAAYQQATGYTDQAIADLINGAPSTLDTLGEIAQAMQENNDVVDTLEAAVGTKASQAELDGHIGNSTIHITVSERQVWNNKQTTIGDTKDNTVSFSSRDSTAPVAWSDVSVLSSGEKHSSIFNKISTMFRNIRYLYKMLGTADISAIGDGTVKGAIKSLNTNLCVIQTDERLIALDNSDTIIVELQYVIKTLICVHTNGETPAVIDRYNYNYDSNSKNSKLLLHFADTYNIPVRIRIVYI